jgi:hypothetical protein
MRARVIHTFTYSYSAPVLLGPHRFCLKPRGQGFQRLLDFQLTISPQPGRQYPLVAASGDEIIRARFNGPCEAFSVQASSLVETETPPLLQACLEGNEPLLPYPWATSTGIWPAAWRAGCRMASTIQPRWTWPRRR